MKTASVIFALVWFLSGCGTPLGECDAQARAGYDADLGDVGVGNHPGIHVGQLVIQSRCGTCHASTAVGTGRVGAPAELDFDVGFRESEAADPAVQARVNAAAAVIGEWKEEMWAEIDSDRMPPGKPLGFNEVTGVDEKVAVRNWLACGAEIRPTPVATVDPTDNELAQAMPGLTICFGCHNPEAAPAFGTSVVLVQDTISPDVCDVYTALTTGSSACGAGPLVVASQPDMSHVVNLVEGNAMNCGGTVGMPAGNPLVNSDPTTVGHLRMWVANGAQAPMGCQ